MSALAGILRWDGLPDNDESTIRMLKRMPERTLDGININRDGFASFGFGNLSHRPAAKICAEPFFHTASGTMAVIDGRLDNRIEILTFLGLSLENHISNAEILAHLYLKKGDHFPEYLTGDFAAAIWDPRAKRLLLARDPLGIKPLYYYSHRSGTVFSSEIQAMESIFDLRLTPNDFMLVQYLTGDFYGKESTFYTSVKQLPPGHILKLEAEKPPLLSSYWHFRKQDLSCLKTRQDYLDRFYFLFEQAVHDRIQTQYPVGVLLSGGLDSTQITATAESLRLRNPSLPAIRNICLLVEGFLQEEKTSLDKLKEKYSTPIETVTAEKENIASSTFELFMETGNTPHLDGYLTTPLLLKRLQSHGCRTILSGFGANELVNPFEFGQLEDALLRFQIKKFKHEITRFSHTLHCKRSELFESIIKETLIDSAPDLLRAAKRFLDLMSNRWLRPDFKRLHPVWPPARDKVFNRLSGQKTWKALTEPMAGMAFSQMDQIAGKHSMDVCFPFLDIRLVEFFLSIPDHIKIEGGYRKSFAQEALARVVPMPIRTEDDIHCYLPALERSERIRLEISRLKTYLSNPNSPIFKYVHHKAIAEMTSKALKTLRADLPFLWRLARLNAWLESL